MKTSKDQATFELINKYLMKDLSIAQLAEFEAALIRDNSLVEEVEKVKREIFLVKEYAFRQQLDSIHKDLYTHKKKGKNVRLQLVSGIAATLILAIGIWSLYISNKASSEEMFHQNFQPYPNLLSIRTDASDTINWMKAMEYYSSGKYEKCLHLLNSIEFPTHFRQDHLFYKGICLMSINDHEMAIETFQLLTNEGIKYQEQINWYMALNLIILDRKSEALLNLNKINSENYKYAEAIELIEWIKE